MKSSGIRQCAITIGAASLLASCSGSPAPVDDVGFRAPWMLPEAVGRDLLYVSKPFYPGARDVYIYTYPSGKLVGRLNGLGQPEGECVDKAGNVFVVDAYVDAYDSEVFEYAHGGTSPIATIGVPYAGATGCSIDASAEKLAVSGGTAAADVAIFAYKPKRGWRFPKTYRVPSMAYGAFCAYDGRGNLYVDGANHSQSFDLAELPRGSTAFTSISLNHGIGGPGQLQWNGNALAIGDTGVSPSTIYQFSISGSNGTEVGSTVLSGSTTVEQYWIQGKTVIAPDYRAADVGLWAYPSGGSARSTISLSGPFGAAVSLASKERRR